MPAQSDTTSGSAHPAVSPRQGEVRVEYDRTGRVLASSGREIEFDFLRGIAILLVLDFHAPISWMSYPLRLLGFPNFGWAGVDIFFVLSGFLVGGLLIKEWRLKGSIDSRRFLIRRGFKIWPQYYVFLGLMLLTRHRTLHELWGNILNLQNYLGGIPHTWSLAVEEHAYLFLVVCLAFAARRNVRPARIAAGLGALCAAIAFGRLWLATHGHAFVVQTHTRMDGILYGVLLAMLYHFWPDHFRRWQQQRWIWFAVVAGALVFLRLQTDAPWSASIGWDAANLLGVALLMLLYRAGVRTKHATPYRFIAAIGVYSYGIYLWHVAVIAPSLAIAVHLPHGVAPICRAVLPIIAGISLGAAFTKIVELPALKLRDRLYPRRVDSPVGSPAADEQAQQSRSLQAAGQIANA